MMEHTTSLFLRDGFLLLAFALGFVLLFRRFGLGATLGYLVAGAVVGPHVLALIGDAERMSGVGELGIVLLLFIVGLELNPARLWRLRHEIFGMGLLQVVLCGLAVTGVVLLATEFSPEAALALGLPLALSSTAQVLPMLRSAGRLRTPFGERAFAILLFQDLSIIPLITIVAAMSRNPADEGGPPGWQLALLTLAAMAGLIAAGRFAIRPLFRSILLGLFFLSVGMMLDLGAIAERPGFVFGMALALIVVKAAVIFGIARAFRIAWRPALGLGLLLSQGGEFGFVLFTAGGSALLISDEAASGFGGGVTLSMATTPFLMMATRKLREEPVRDLGTREAPSDQAASALVVGYGRFGQTVAQTLMAGGIPVTLVDTDIEMIDVAEQFGAKVYFGDGTRP